VDILKVIDPGDEVILPSPTYSTHIQQVIIASGKPVLVPTIEEEGFIWDIDGIRDAITSRTKAIMYCSPSNPTGTVFSEEQLRQLAEVALENDLMVITDEAYEYFTYNGHKHFSIASIPEMVKNVVSCYIFTKTFSQTIVRRGRRFNDFLQKTLERSKGVNNSWDSFWTNRRRAFKDLVLCL